MAEAFTLGYGSAYTQGTTSLVTLSSSLVASNAAKGRRLYFRRIEQQVIGFRDELAVALRAKGEQ